MGEADCFCFVLLILVLWCPLRLVTDLFGAFAFASVSWLVAVLSHTSTSPASFQRTQLHPKIYGSQYTKSGIEPLFVYVSGSDY